MAVSAGEDAGEALGLDGRVVAEGAAGAGEMGFRTVVTSNEITGSETFVHLDADGRDWVMLLHGVHTFEPGLDLEVKVGRDKVMRFDSGGRALSKTLESA